MIAIDTNVLSIFLYQSCSVPDDFRTKKPIPNARERVQELISDIEKSGEQVVIPTPALAEAMVAAAPDVQPYLDVLNSSSHFKISAFGQRAAVEVALHLRAAKVAGDKRDKLSSDDCVWDKVNFDRQIVAIAKVEGVSRIYSTDRHVHHHAEIWGIDCKNISDLGEPPLKARGLFDEENASKAIEPVAVDIGRSSDGHPEDRSDAEAAEEKAEGKETGKE